MKIRDSGMPGEPLWSSFFDLEMILKQMEITSDLESVVDLGCGFGTFSIPVSKIIKGNVQAFDIDEEMIDLCKHKINNEGITNISLCQKDFITDGSGFPNDSTDYVMLFNILHYENPHQILSEVYRILKPKSKAGIIHWRRDIPTPRGPQLDIRPKPESCKKWAIESGFIVTKELILEPFHFGVLIQKP